MKSGLRPPRADLDHYVLHQCHLCAARFSEDDAFALHIGRHRQHPVSNSHPTNQRQAERAMIEDLMEVFDATRS